MDKLTKRALQAQVEAAVRLLFSDAMQRTLSEQPRRMSIVKTATKLSRRRVSSPSPASKLKPATYVPFPGHDPTRPN
jgi:hypothetical protein